MHPPPPPLPSASATHRPRPGHRRRRQQRRRPPKSCCDRVNALCCCLHSLVPRTLRAQLWAAAGWPAPQDDHNDDEERHQQQLGRRRQYYGRVLSDSDSDESEDEEQQAVPPRECELPSLGHGGRPAVTFPAAAAAAGFPAPAGAAGALQSGKPLACEEPPAAAAAGAAATAVGSSSGGGKTLAGDGEEDVRECVICMEEFTTDNPEMHTLCSCGENRARFHYPCLIVYLERRGRRSHICPTCRGPLYWEELV